MGRWEQLADPAVVIVQPLDVVLTEVLTVLNLNEDEGGITPIGDSVGSADWNVNRRTASEIMIHPI